MYPKLKKSVPHFLQIFSRLSQDEDMHVRKTCAENILQVSKLCSPQVRHDIISPIFVLLMADSSRWVQGPAYIDLGRFIALFHNPSRSSFNVTEEGVLVSASTCVDDELNNCKTNDEDDNKMDANNNNENSINTTTKNNNSNNKINNNNNNNNNINKNHHNKNNNNNNNNKITSHLLLTRF